jgi:hypothetical protein
MRTKTSPGIPTTYYVGLSTTEPSIDGTGATEPGSSTGYARVKLTDLSTPANGVVTNSSTLDFPESTGSWGTITHYVIYNALTGGTLLMYGKINPSRAVEEGTTISVKKSSLKISVVSTTN